MGLRMSKEFGTFDLIGAPDPMTDEQREFARKRDRMTKIAGCFAAASVAWQSALSAERAGDERNARLWRIDAEAYEREGREALAER